MAPNGLCLTGSGVLAFTFSIYGGDYLAMTKAIRSRWCDEHATLGGSRCEVGGGGTVSVAKIFISYRRQDTGQIVASIYNFLAEAFGPGNVFVDTRNIPDGEYFKLVIEHNIRDAAVMLVVLGKNWLGSENNGHRRIDEQGDLVRAEVSLGLELARQGRLTLIPVLIDDTPMPADLPPDLSDVRWRNAAQVHSSLIYLTDDINRLLADIDKLGIPRQVSGRIEQPPDRFVLLGGAFAVDSGSGPSPHVSSKSDSHSSPNVAAPPTPPNAASYPNPSSPQRSLPKPPISSSRPPVATATKAGNNLLLVLLALFMELPGLIRGGIIVVVIVATVAAVMNHGGGLTEHSTCQQYEQASYSDQTTVLQQMMAAHGDKGDIGTARLSVGLYCNVMGPNAPIDGVYNG